MENKIWTEEQMKKARGAHSAEELLGLARSEGVDMSAEEAAELFELIDMKTGELADEELENVAGGGCKTKVNGKRYTVVTSGCRCFNGKFKAAEFGKDSSTIREFWRDWGSSGKRSCARCAHLKFKGGIGYCSVS